MISGRSSETTYEQTGILEAGIDLLGDRGAAEHVPALEHQHLPPRAREIGGVDQTVVPAADDDDVVVVHNECADGTELGTDAEHASRGSAARGSAERRRGSEPGGPRLAGSRGVACDDAADTRDGRTRIGVVRHS